MRLAYGARRILHQGPSTMPRRAAQRDFQAAAAPCPDTAGRPTLSAGPDIP